MKNLNIGDVARVRAVAYKHYDYGESYDKWVKKQITEVTVRSHLVRPFNAVIVGKKTLMEGTLYPRREEFPAELIVSKGVTVWLVSIGWRNKPKLVLDEDLAPCDVEFVLPDMGRHMCVLEEPQLLLPNYSFAYPIVMRGGKLCFGRGQT